MTIESKLPGALRRDLLLLAMAFAAILCLAACQPAQLPEAAPITTATESEVEVPPRAPEGVHASEPTMPASPLAVSPEDVDFVGWYIDQGGGSQLLACGQSVALPVENPAFLRDLKAKLGSGRKPVYVSLRVRLAAGSRLEVTEVRQFGADETPVVDCVLNQ